MSRTWSTRRLVAVPVALVAALLAASACTPVQAGAAATIGHGRITTQQLDANVNELHAALKGQEPAGVTASKTVVYVLQTMVFNTVVAFAAERNDIRVKPTDVAAQRVSLESQNGGKAGLDKLAANQGIAPSQIDHILWSNMVVSQLGIKLLPHGTAAEKQNAVKNYLTKLSVELNTNISPRYGAWDPSTLAIGTAPLTVATPRSGA